MINKYKLIPTFGPAVEITTELHEGKESVIFAPKPLDWMIGRTWDNCLIYTNRRGYTVEQTQQGDASVLPSTSISPARNTGRGK